MFKGFVGGCIRPLVIIRRGVTAYGGIGYMHFIQSIQIRKFAVLPLFMGFWDISYINSRVILGRESKTAYGGQ